MWGETTRTLVQYRGVVHCVGGDNTHSSAVQGVVHCVGGDNTHTSAVQGGGPLCGGRQHAH